MATLAVLHVNLTSKAASGRGFKLLNATWGSTNCRHEAIRQCLCNRHQTIAKHLWVQAHACGRDDRAAPHAFKSTV